MALSELRRGRVAALLQDEDVFATTLLAIVIDAYGTEVLGPAETGWTPETLRLELQDDFDVVVPDANMDKLVAGIALLTSDDFYKRTPRFVQLCNALSGSEMSARFDKADAAECAWGMTEAMLLAPPEEDEPFSDEIRHYLGQILDEEGIADPPDLLRLAIRDRVPADVAVADLPTEDPSSFAASYRARADRKQEIQEMLEENVEAMLSQLASLPGAPQRDELLSRMRKG